MESNYFQELKKYFERFPGIGPRQASRFIWALLDFSNDDRKKFSSLIVSLDQHLNRCDSCFRVFPVKNEILTNENSRRGRAASQSESFPLASGAKEFSGDKISFVCLFCAKNSKRDHSKIMVVEKDNDLLSIEKSGAYKGLYHVLGGLIDPLEKNELARERMKKLYGKLKSLPGKKSDFFRDLKSDFEESDDTEIILALSPTKLGEFTSNYAHKVLEPLQVKITRLARGLSSGVELEYADEYTLRHALDNRK